MGASGHCAHPIGHALICIRGGEGTGLICPRGELCHLTYKSQQRAALWCLHCPLMHTHRSYKHTSRLPPPPDSRLGLCVSHQIISGTTHIFFFFKHMDLHLVKLELQGAPSVGITVGGKWEFKACKQNTVQMQICIRLTNYLEIHIVSYLSVSEVPADKQSCFHCPYKCCVDRLR